MKRILAAVLAIVMALSCMACGNNEAQGNQETSEVEVKDVVELLTNVWAAYPGEIFSVMGGDYENPVMNQPGFFDVKNPESLETMLAMPAEGVDLIDDAASLIHMMNANTFTAGAFHVANSSDLQTVADIMKDSIMNRQWICGFPEKMLIVSVGSEYMVSMFGTVDIVDNFKTALSEVYDAKVLHEENLV